MAIVVKISSVDVGYEADPPLSVKTRRGRTSEARFGIGVTAGTQPYSRGNSVSVYVDEVLIFSGEIDTIEERSYDPAENYLHFRVRAVGHDILLRRTRIWEHYADTTADAIFTDLVDRYLPGYTVTGVGANAVSIDDIRFGGDTLDEAFDKLASRTLTWEWSVSAGRDFTFNDADSLAAAGFNLTDAPSAKSYSDLELNRSAAEYFNAVVLYGGEGASASVKEQIAKAHTEVNWAVSARVAVLSAAVDITGGGSTAEVVGELGVDDESSIDFGYRSTPDQIIERVGTITSGTRTMEFTYQAYRGLIFAYRDQEEIDSRGLFLAVLRDNTITTMSDAYQASLAFLTRHNAYEAERIKFETWDAGLVPGTAMTVTLSSRNLSGTFIIEDVETREVVPGKVRYRVVCENGNLFEGSKQGLRRTLRQTSQSMDPDTDDALRLPLSGTECMEIDTEVTVVAA